MIRDQAEDLRCADSARLGLWGRSRLGIGFRLRFRLRGGFRLWLRCRLFERGDGRFHATASADHRYLPQTLTKQLCGLDAHSGVLGDERVGRIHESTHLDQASFGVSSGLRKARSCGLGAGSKIGSCLRRTRRLSGSNISSNIRTTLPELITTSRSISVGLSQTISISLRTRRVVRSRLRRTRRLSGSNISSNIRT
ncbi:MAG: hypothetical protein ACOYEV_12790, partial [Candidatus Nanopelagicales bacterium]